MSATPQHNAGCGRAIIRQQEHPDNLLRVMCKCASYLSKCTGPELFKQLDRTARDLTRQLLRRILVKLSCRFQHLQLSTKAANGPCRGDGRPSPALLGDRVAHAWAQNARRRNQGQCGHNYSHHCVLAQAGYAVAEEVARGLALIESSITRTRCLRVQIVGVAFAKRFTSGRARRAHYHHT